jgi:DNA replication protein DnaC
MTSWEDAAMNDEFKNRVKALGLMSVMENWSRYSNQPWLRSLVEEEEAFRTRSSFQRKLHAAKLGDFKLVAEFDWKWPRKIDRTAIEELLSLEFIRGKENIVLIGGNGTGKTMIAKNLVFEWIKRGLTGLHVTADEMLARLSRYESGGLYSRGLAQYARVDLLLIDELGQVSFGQRHADLLFAVINARYQKKPTIITTNAHFRSWNELFPSATCVATIVDRLIHHSEIIEIDGDSYRRKEAMEKKEEKTKRRRGRKNSSGG